MATGLEIRWQDAKDIIFAGIIGTGGVYTVTVTRVIDGAPQEDVLEYVNVVLILSQRPFFSITQIKHYIETQIVVIIVFCIKGCAVVSKF